MALSGGHADKLGNRYEKWWTLYQLLRILEDNARSIRIEDPNPDKTEFVIQTTKREELHQAKRSKTEGSWTIADLGKNGQRLLKTIYSELVGNNKIFVFVSGTDAPQFREIIERSKDAKDLKEFQEVFLKAQKHSNSFDVLMQEFDSSDPETLFDILKRIQIETASENILEKLVQASLRGLFLEQPELIINSLWALIEKSVHQILTKPDVVNYLQRKGYQLRKLIHPKDSVQILKGITVKTLSAIEKRLINRSVISRDVSREIIEILKTEEKSNEIVLLGRAGGGKTSVLFECITELQKTNSNILYLGLDKIPQSSTTVELGENLGMEESPALLLNTATFKKNMPVILVLDQLDAMSITSGRNEFLFDVVENLLDEIQGFRRHRVIHVVLVCRKFDWENDHRLRRLTDKNHKQFQIIDFTPDEVKTSLEQAGFNHRNLSQSQIELLRIPQHLAVFLEAYDPNSTGETFISQKDLFDQYWETKKIAINQKLVGHPDSWIEIIHALVTEMSAMESLAVRKEFLDRFPENYIRIMSSEGVLTLENDQYSFGHESFFDYCSARLFVVDKNSLVEFLTNSEQHLFKRSQVRQILVYLRDSAFNQYIQELAALLNHEQVRVHIKDVALAVLFSAPNPNNDEWNLIKWWVDKRVKALKENSNSDKFTLLVWNRFIDSDSWFHLADALGLIETWLASGNKALLNTTMWYLERHQKQVGDGGDRGDRIVQLLAPYENMSEEWPRLFSELFRFTALERSRPLFELFIKFLKSGKLDDNTLPFSIYNNFWRNFYNMEEVHCDWLPEVIANWIHRRKVVFETNRKSGGSDSWFKNFANDEFGGKHILNAAQKAPIQYLELVLPEILSLSREAIYKSDSSPPLRDNVWRTPSINGLGFVDNALIHGVRESLELVSKQNYNYLKRVLGILLAEETYIANYFVLNIFTCNAKEMADFAVEELTTNTWRLQCGHSESPYWMAMQMLEKIAPCCSPERLNQLENIILGYNPDYEKEAGNQEYRGRAQRAFLSTIPSTLLSADANRRFQELQRKFSYSEQEPKEFKAYTVVSPISKPIAKIMTDEQWLKAIQTYSKEERARDWEHPEKGGALELSRMLEMMAKEEPIRFAKLCLRLPLDSNTHYLSGCLGGLRETDAPSDLKLELCKKAFQDARDSHGRAICDLLGSIDDSLSDDTVEMLKHFALNDPDPEIELWDGDATDGTVYYGGDPESHGINTTRGRAAEAIREIIRRDHKNLEKFKEYLPMMAKDPSLAVRICVAGIILEISSIDKTFSMELFDTLLTPLGDKDKQLLKLRDKLGVVGEVFNRLLSKHLRKDDLLFTSRSVDYFIYYNLKSQYKDLDKYLKRMVRSLDPEVQKSGARFLALASLYYPRLQKRVKRLLHRSSSFRFGIAQVASANITESEHRAWCESTLIKLFNDPDIEVRRQVGAFMSHLKTSPLDQYESLIRSLCESEAFAEGSYVLIQTLEDTTQKLPGIALHVCSQFLEKFSSEAKNIQTSFSGDVIGISKILFRTYHQHQNDKWAKKCLDTIDKMCLEDIHSVRTGFLEYER